MSALSAHRARPGRKAGWWSRAARRRSCNWLGTSAGSISTRPAASGSPTSACSPTPDACSSAPDDALWYENSVPFCCSQLGTASTAKSSCPTVPPSHRPTTGKPSAPARARSEARRARAARRGGAEAGALHPARGRHRLAPQLTALRPLRRRAAGVAQKATPGVGCSLDPSPAAPSPGRLTAHGALGCSPPPPRVPRRHACPCLDALCASRARVSGTDGAATAPAVAAPPPRRARCRRRRRRRLLAVSPSVWCVVRACARSARQRPHPSRARPRRRRPRRRPRPRRRGCGDSWRQSESGRLSSVEPSGGGNDGSESQRRTWPKNHDRTTTTRTRLTRRTWPGLQPTPPLRGGARSKERN